MIQSNLYPVYLLRSLSPPQELSPYNKGLGRIRGKVEGLPYMDVDKDWWIVQLVDPDQINHYQYSCIAVPSCRLESIDKQVSNPFPLPEG